MSGSGAEIVRLWQEIRESPGGALRYDLETLDVTIQVFKSNHHSLHELLEHYENPDFAFGIWPGQVGDFLVEVAVRLHNFLASVMTLVEHTRVFMRSRFRGQPLMEEYRRRIKDSFVHSPVVQLVQDMRDYTLHRKLPVTGAQISGTRPPQVLLDVERLKDWKGWSDEAKVLLDEAGDSISLRHLVDEYERLTGELYPWMEDRIREIHAEEFAELERLEERVAELEATKEN